MLTKKDGLVGIQDSLDSSDHKVMEFSVMWGQSRAISKITMLDFKRANFGLFRDLLGRIQWE